MAGAGTAYKLLGTFLKLKKACTKVFLSFDSDSDGDMHVTLKVHVPGHDNQAPRRGLSAQEAGGGARNPGPLPRTSSSCNPYPCPCKKGKEARPGTCPCPYLKGKEARPCSSI